MCGRACVRVRIGIAGAVGIGHGAVEGGGGFAAGAGCRVTPSSISTVVLDHLGGNANCGECWVVVGVVAVLFHLFPALLLVALALFAFPPEDDASQHQQADDNKRHHDSNGRLAAGGQSVALFALWFLRRDIGGGGS